LAVRLQPRSSQNAIQGEQDGALRIRVTAPPVDSAANQALIDLLASTLDCARGQLTLVRGHRSRQKLISVSGVALPRILQRLTPPAAPR
jgi:uncharacterized protein